MGRFGFNDSYKGDPYFRFAPVYSSTIFIFIGILISCLAFLSLFFKRKQYEQKYVLYFSILSILSLFLLKSLHEPFSSINEWLYLNFPGFLIFRQNYDKIGQVFIFSYAFLIGFSMSRIYDSLKNKLLKIGVTLTIFILIYGVYAFPFWTGDVIYSGGKVLPSQHINIPDYYDDVGNYVNTKNNDFKVISLPFSARLTWVAYSWGYVGQDPQLQIFNKSIFLGNVPATNKISSNILYLFDNNNREIYKYLSLFNLRYLLVHDDIAYNFYDGTKNPEEINSKLENQNNIIFDGKFGNITIYSINSSKYIPQIYTTNKYQFSDKLNTMFNLIGGVAFVPGDSIIFVEETLKKEEINRLKEKEEFDRYNKFIPIPLNDSSFEESIWQPSVGDCCNANPGYPKISAELSDDSSYGDKSLNLTSENHCACVAQNIPEFNNDSVYKIRIDYKHITGISPKLCIWTNGCNKCSINRDLDNSTEWKTYDDYLTFEKCATKANIYLYSNQPSSSEPNTLYFYSNSNGEQTTSNLYDNVRVEKIAPDEYSYVNELSPTNIFNDSSFETGTWQEKAGDCCNGNAGAPSIFAGQSEDSSDGIYSLNLTSNNHCACIAQNINLDRSSCYTITFDYKHISGEAPKFCLWKPELSKCDPIQILETSNDWETYSFTTCTQSIPERTTNLYDNVRIEKVIFSNESGYHAQTTFKKINPTRYQVKVENATQPFFLVFSESFHPEWKAYIEDKDIQFTDIIAEYERVKVKEARHEMTFTPGDVFYLLKEPLSEDTHFTANGYANSWYIDPKVLDKDGDGNFTLTLYFKPQSYFYLGLAISLATFILCILYLIFNGTKPYQNAMNGLKSSFSKTDFMMNGWRKNRRKEEPHKSGTNWKKEKMETPSMKIPKIVTKTVGAINDRSRLIIKRRSNPELKALHRHVVHERQGYHYHKKKTIMESLGDLKEKLTKKKK